MNDPIASALLMVADLEINFPIFMDRADPEHWELYFILKGYTWC